MFSPESKLAPEPISFESALDEALFKVTKRFKEVPDIDELTLHGKEEFRKIWESCFGRNGYMKILPLEEQEEAKQLLATSYVIAEYAHQNQKRESGEQYVFHVLSVAKRIAEVHHKKAWVIASALDHDVLEDSKKYGHLVTRRSLRKLLPNHREEVQATVEALTQVKAKSKDNEFVKTLQKVIEESINRPEVLLIKIEDRIHNLSTIDSMPLEKQIKKAEETLHIYVPLAWKFGYLKEAEELSKMSLQIIDNITTGGVVNRKIESVQQHIQEHVDLQALSQQIRMTSLNNSRFLDILLENPPTKELYDVISELDQNESRTPDKWEFPEDKWFINATVVLKDDPIDDMVHESGDFLVGYAQDIFRPFLQIALDKNITSLSERDFFGWAPFLRKLSYGNVNGTNYFTLRLKNGLNLRMRVIPLQQYQLEHLTLGEESTVQRHPRYDTIDLEELKQATFRKLYDQSMSDNDTPDDIISFGESLHGNFIITVNEIKDKSYLGETIVPNNSTVLDFLLRYKQFHLVQKVVINGQECKDFSYQLQPTDTVAIHFAGRYADSMDPDVSWLNSLSVAIFRKPEIYQALRRRYLFLKRTKSDHFEVYKEAIKDHGWRRITRRVDHDPNMYDFAKATHLLLSNKYTTEDILLASGLGELTDEQFAALSTTMESYWKSLYTLTVQIKDIAGVQSTVTNKLRWSIAITGKKNVDIVHDVVQRIRGGERTQLVFYFDPADVRPEVMNAVTQVLSSIDGVISSQVTIFEDK